MKKAFLDEHHAAEILDLPDDTVIEDFDKENWRGVWFQAVEIWWEDGMAMYTVMRDGFKGFVDRSDFDVYCDLRFTYIDGQNMTWDELEDQNHCVGKYS